MSSRLLLNAVAALALVAAPLSAGSATPAPPDTATKLQETLAKRFPATKIVSVSPAPMPGWFEVFTGDSIAYADASGDYLLLGRLVDTRTQRDMTGPRLDELSAIDFSQLPLDKAIKIVRGDGSRIIAVFSDPDCPYCLELEKQLEAIPNTTTYVFLYPLPDLHPDAPAKARAVWCADDRATAWRQWMLERRLPEDRKCDASDLDTVANLGKTLRVNSTPTLFLANGQRLGGVMEQERFEALLEKRLQPARAAVQGAAR